MAGGLETCVHLTQYVALKLRKRGEDVNTAEESPLFFSEGHIRTSSCLSLAKLTAVVEPVEGDLSILADLDEVAVGITHVAAPFPAVIV